MPADRHEVRVRVLTGEDAPWLVALDREGSYDYLEPKEWEEGKLAAELDEGVWATDEQVGWAVLVDGRPAGVAFARKLTSSDGVLEIRLARGARGQGVGREALRQLAEHHFVSSPSLRRLVGSAHEDNVAMQRAFNAAGFRMEARFRDAVARPDGGFASAWGYALTRGDWAAGRHRTAAEGYDLHGLTFDVDETTGEPTPRGLTFRFLHEGRRIIGRYGDGRHLEGELAGILVDDVLRHRFVHEAGDDDAVTGSGSARLQRRGDGRLELVDEWMTDEGRSGRRVLIERT